MPKGIGRGFVAMRYRAARRRLQRANRVTGTGFRVDPGANPVGAWSPQASAVRNTLHAQESHG